MEKLVSIIIPLYNCESYIERCLDSLLSQDHKNFEALLIDDGSSDGTEAIARGYAERDSRILYFRKENGGVSSARNFGIERARGEYFAFVDGDDEVLPCFLSTLVSALETTASDVAVISPIVRIGGKDVPYKDNTDIQTFSSADATKEALRGVLFAGHLCTKIFKANLFYEIRLREDLAICEDLVAVYELFAQCEKVAFTDVHCYIYYTNADSAMNTEFKESFLSYITATEYLAKRVSEELPEAYSYALTALVNAYIDVVAKLYRCGRLTKELHTEYRQRLKDVATAEVLALMPRYKVILAKAIMGTRLRYAVTLRCFTIAKRLVYFFKNK